VLVTQTELTEANPKAPVTGTGGTTASTSTVASFFPHGMDKKIRNLISVLTTFPLELVFGSSKYRKVMHTHVYRGTIHNSQVMETAKMPHH
jgi:hypothetical protein